MDTKKKKSTILFLILLYLSLWVFFFRNQKLTVYKININKSVISSKTFILSPLITNNNIWYLNVNPASPTIPTKIKMGGLKYYWLSLVEIVNTNNIPYANFISASKRIAEVENWNSEMRIVGGIKNVKELKQWWSKNTPETWMFFNYKNYNSWEGSLVRYLSSWEKQIKNINSPNTLENIMNIRGHLKKYQEKLYLLIYNSSNSSREKEYLFKLTNEVHSYLDSQLNYYIPNYDTSNINYSLNEIHQKKLFGIYNILLKIDNLSLPVDKKPALEIDNKIIYGKLLDNNIINYKNVVLNDDINHIILNLNLTNIINKNNNWLNILAEDGSYQYVLSIPNLDNKMTYLMNFSYRTDQKINLQLIAKYHEEKQEVEQAVLNKELLPLNKRIYGSEYFSLPQREVLEYFLLINSPQPLSYDNLKLIKVNIQPFLTPELILEKTGDLPSSNIEYLKINSQKYNIKVTNTTSKINKAIIDSFYPWWQIKSKTYNPDVNSLCLTIWYWPIRFLFISLACLLFLTGCCYWLRKRGQKNWIGKILFLVIKHVKMISKKLLYFILETIKKLRFIFSFFFFVFTALFLIIYLFIDIGQNNILIIYSVIFWILFLIISRLNYQGNFITTIMFLCFCALSINYKNEILTEKLATLAFTFLVVGAFQSLLIRKSKQHK